MKVSHGVQTPKRTTTKSSPRATKKPPAGQLWKSVLVPTDFSESSMKALNYGVTLAQMMGAKLTLAHIVVPVAAPDLVYGPVSWDEEVAVKEARKRLKELRMEGGTEVLERARIVVRRGHPYHEIDQIAKDIKAGLIVVSTHGRTGLRHLLLGSVAERVIRHAPCPVLVVREDEHEFVY